MKSFNPPFGYTWAGEWIDADDGRPEMAHTGIVVTRDGQLVTGAPAEPALRFHDPDGRIAREVAIEATELHGLALVEEDGEELIWIADPAAKTVAEGAELVNRCGERAQVVKVDFDGTVRQSLEDPPILDSRETYRPTGVTVDERRFGGSGDIWVADGYGEGRLHRYAADGRLLDSVDGEGNGGPLLQPHDLMIDRRRGEPELYVADRINGRLQVLDLDGCFKRTVGAGQLPGPTQMAVSGDLLIVTDLLVGRVSLLDRDDRLAGHLFAHPDPPRTWDVQPDGWPNARSPDGLIVRAPLRPGVFHTPHGVAAGADGTIYVSEFAIGGRIAVLRPSATRRPGRAGR